MNKKIHFLLLLLFIFIGSVIFFGFFADYTGFYQEKLSLFIFSGDFLREQVSRPGSVLVYAGKFLSSFFYEPLLGAIIISLIITLSVWFMSAIIKNLTGEHKILIPFTAGILLIILQSNYQYLVYNNLGLLLQLVFIHSINRYLKGYLPIILFPFWHLVTGSFAAIAATMYIIMLAGKSVRTAWLQIILLPMTYLFTVWLLKQYFLFHTLPDLLIYPLSPEDTGSQIPLLIITAVFIALTPLTGNHKISIRKLSPSFEPTRVFIANAAIVAVIVVVFILRFDKTNKEYFTVQKLFFNEKYQEVTKYITKHPTTNRLTIYLNNIALSETGKLNERLFWFPQSPDGQSLFLKWEMYAEVLKLGGYFYYTTGMINEAHRWAFENMVIKGLSPEDLKLLIKTEIINGNYLMASRYNSNLKRTVFYRKEAMRFEKLLASPDLIETDNELGSRRKWKASHDFFSITDDPYVNIERVFSSDSLNRKVYEYRMAFLMITEDYERISEGLSKLPLYGYSKIPVHLEEAALVCKMSGSGVPGSIRINPQTESRFGQFLDLFRQYGNNLNTAQPFLKKRFGNTFWYWGFYH